jgi:hypothetical protein
MSTETITDESLREVAVQHLKKRQDFRAHLLVYALFNAAAWALWALTGTGFPWPAFITAFWGIGLIMNAYDVYGRRPITEQDVAREIERLRRG